MMAAPSLDTRPVVGDQANMARLQADYEELFAKHGVGGRQYYRWAGFVLSSRSMGPDPSALGAAAMASTG